MAPKEHFSENYSSLGIKLTRTRDEDLLTGDLWLEGKRVDDGVGDLWRVHDRIYDLTPFIKNHPGGQEWLILTKGTDITEAFEAHHIKGQAEYILEKYYVKEADTPRISPFTFKDDGFYRTLKRKIKKELTKVPTTTKYKTKIIADVLFCTYLVFAVLACELEKYSLGFFAGFLLTLLTNVAHNFIHRKNNFRMYYMDLSMMLSREFRISHALSHHLYPNTVKDMEITAFEPNIYFFPKPKPNSNKYFPWIYMLVLFPFLHMINYAATIRSYIKRRNFNLAALIPFATLLLMLILTKATFLKCLIMFFWIILCTSFFFFMIGKTAAHHHPDIFHDGDTPRPKEELDFGIHQLDAVGDRTDIQGLFLTLTTYGEHALHHLFPTLDHGLLAHLHPIFMSTCIDFGIEWKLFSSMELFFGTLRQISRCTPNPHPPDSSFKKI